jgi:hypothetical protein
MSRSPFRLSKTIGRHYSVDPEDVLKTKKLLKELGHFETPAYGMTRYPDDPMFQGIEQFQDDFDLYRDGVMNPDGETIEKLNEVLDYRDRNSTPKQQEAEKADSPQTDRNRPDPGRNRPDGQPEKDQEEQEIALAPAIPIIVYEIAAAFSMGLAAAYAWWLSLSAEEKKQVREHLNKIQESGPADDPADDDCERLYKTDIDTCRQIAKTRGKQAGARCYASANERYAACRRGRPLPPLDTWNN